MAHEYVPVAPGIDMTRALGKARLTKKWLREYLRDHPEKDFRNLGLRPGAYVNGEDAVRYDLTLQVMRDGTTVAMVNFREVDEFLPVPEGAKPVKSGRRILQAVVS